MDLNGVEHIQFNALGGADTVTVNDLTGTNVNQVAVNLAGSGGGGDSQLDSVIVNGTNNADMIGIASSGSSVVINGLAAKTTVSGTDAALDKLTVNGLGGDDVINTSGLHAGQINLTINGGAGNDLIIGSAGDDLVTGGTGADTALLGAGDDTFVWNPGDGSDIVEGQTGIDTLAFNGANVSEKIDISANASRARLTRDVANIAMDLNGMQAIDVTARGGADTLTVGDLTGTVVTNVNLDLSGTPGSGIGDGQVDTVVLNATSANDVITVMNSGGSIIVSGLSATVAISGFDATDQLVINGLGGDDVITASGLSGIQLTANGGDGDDVLIGGASPATLSGGAGDDVLIGASGADVLDGGSGDNIVIENGPAPSAAIGMLSPLAPSSFVATDPAHGVSPPADPRASHGALLAPPHA
jgi:Ca2+-binding RTX toxin-like protein